MSSMTLTPTRPEHRAGLSAVPWVGKIDDIGREDDRGGHDGRGYERDETDMSFRQLVDHLTADGDTRAHFAGRRARRTLAEMMPDHDRQPVLLLTRPLTFRSADEACGLCGFWKCRCGGVAPAPESNTLQCDTCSGRFGFTGWTCPACKALGLLTLPMRPTPHERDGRTEPPPAPARPHAVAPERRQP
ncbi:hypothetical protein ACFWFI_05710 [Streptomyces sp. NPDC060209]|uniref:hypothetical protein n=1 Tax=Streptomyces sp. NPDC060209 TaxID=3347073 RepID=UPI00364CDCDA